MIRTFFKFLFRTFFWVCAFVGFVLVSLSLVVYFNFLTPSPKPLAQDSVLTLTLNGSYVEHTNSKGLHSFLLGKDTSLYDLIRALHQAAQDPKIRGLLVRLGGSDLGMAQIQEVREALLAFRKAGKPSWCHTDSFGEMSSGTNLYYLATACDEIWLQPVGAVNLTGLKIETSFAKGALEKLGVKPELIQKKEYKSCAEMFTRDDFSEPSREAKKAIVDSILDQVVDGIAKDRKLPHDQVRDLINNGPYLAQEAYAAKLIDQIDFYQNLKPAVQEKLGGSVSFTGVRSYLNTLVQEEKGGKVALIFGSGVIQREGGSSSLGGVGISADATCKAFQAALADPDVKAIVYRINSDGGSPIASETIYNMIHYAQEYAKKPVIISMSDAAASGGYWISVAGSKIVAHPATLTGSIGVMGGKFVLTDLFEKLGISWDHVSTSENASMWSLNGSYTPEQWLKLNAWIDQMYDAFTRHVAKDRNMDPLQVEKVARGRVWTGEQAIALGLVDQLGGFQTALALAKKEGRLPEEARVEVYPQHPTFLETIISLFEDKEEGFFPEVSTLTAFLDLFKQVRMAFSVLFSSQEIVYAPLGEIK